MKLAVQPDLAEALRRTMQQRDRAIASLANLLTQLQTMQDDRDRYAELYEEADLVRYLAEVERDYWKTHLQKGNQETISRILIELEREYLKKMEQSLNTGKAPG